MKMPAAAIILYSMMVVAQNASWNYRYSELSAGGSFFHFNTNHATGFKSSLFLVLRGGYSLCIDKKSENRKFLLLGASMSGGAFSFRSYYFFKDSLSIYDKSFPVNYHSRIYGCSVEVGLKYEFNNSEKYLFTPYVRPVFSWMTPLFYTLSFDNSGAQYSSGWAFYRNGWLGSYVNPCGEMAIGVQYNLLGRSRNKFYWESACLASSTSFELKKSFLASGLYFNFILFLFKTGVLF